MTTLLIAGCGAGAGAAARSPSASGMSASQPSSTSEPTPSVTTSPTTTPDVEPHVVVLDPGHNGGNASAPDEINRLVPAGRGRTKPCNTTGTATNGGYPEHAFTFDVAQRVQRALTDQGITVVLTRTDDDGVGPCVDRRAAIGNENAADAVVSIHADGHDNPDASGFHIAYSAPPLNDAQGEPTLRLAQTLKEAMLSAGFDLADYIGAQGLAPRDDLAGMNLSERPAILVECGNMRNPAEAAAMESADGRLRYADAITEGVLTYLG